MERANSLNFGPYRLPGVLGRDWTQRSRGRPTETAQANSMEDSLSSPRSWAWIFPMVLQHWHYLSLFLEMETLELREMKPLPLAGGRQSPSVRPTPLTGQGQCQGHGEQRLPPVQEVLGLQPPGKLGPRNVGDMGTVVFMWPWLPSGGCCPPLSYSDGGVLSAPPRPPGSGSVPLQVSPAIAP